MRLAAITAALIVAATWPAVAAPGHDEATDAGVQLDGGVAGYKATQLVLELADGSRVHLPPLPDAGYLVLMPERVLELDRQLVDQAARLKYFEEHPPAPPATNAAWLGVVGTFLTNALQVVPIIIEATRRP